MADWAEYARVMNNSAGVVAADGATGTPEKSFCSECGRAFSREEMIQYGNSWVCAGCKPIFVQKLKEGMTVSGAMEYAGFWLRFGAKVIDWIIVGAVNMILSFAAGLIMFPALSSPNSLAAVILPFILQLFQIAIAAAYTTWFLGKYAATPGKMACGIKVVTGDGDKVSYLRAFGRYFAEMISAIILCIGYIMAAFDEQKRALHDRICDTRVIRK
ncbi:MAG: RDD family protein [Deltaproteobacteria bacterium]|nr:RDD family protein [Deltaproteobacteria bacterium]